MRSVADGLSRSELLDRRADALGTLSAGGGGLCLFLERRSNPARSLWLARSAAFRAPAAARCRSDRAARDHRRAGGLPHGGGRWGLLPSFALWPLELGGSSARERGGGGKRGS